MILSDAQLVYLGNSGVMPSYATDFINNPENVIVPGNPVTIITGAHPKLFGGDRVPFGTIYPDESLQAWVVSFRGTKKLSEWFTDLEALLIRCPWLGLGWSHKGFSDLFMSLQAGGMSIRSFIRSLVTFRNWPLIIQGHSLGAAQALCVASDIGEGCTVVLWACPKVFEDDAAAATLTRFSNLYRLVNVRDWVPDVPERLQPLFPYTHVGAARDFDSAGQVIHSIEAYHSMHTYLHGIDPLQPIDPLYAIAV